MDGLYEQNRDEDVALIMARHALRREQVEENGFENYPTEDDDE